MFGASAYRMGGADRENPPREEAEQAGGAADRKNGFHLWDPHASEVLLVTRPGNGSDPKVLQMAKKSGDWWAMLTPSLPGAEYAFVSTWVQELRCKEGQDVARYGMPHDEADLPLCPAVGESHPAIMAPSAWPHTPTTVTPCGEGQTDTIASEDREFKRQTSAAERLDRSEFLLEVSDLSLVAAEAEGVRINFYVASRLRVDQVEVLAVDDSWGPLSLQRTAETAPGEPTLWIVDAPEWLSPLSPSEVVVRVRRRDWRIDPYAIILSSNPCVDTPIKELEAPPGPALWSVVAPRPQPPPAFRRRADRELMIYEMHLGSFTPDGTIASATAKLSHLSNLGFTAISVMPVQQDARRIRKEQVDMWGYDVLSFMAIDYVLGTPADLKAFVAEAHRLGLAVLIDFVINHLMWGADSMYGQQYFIPQDTPWGHRPDFSQPEVCSLVLSAVEFFLLGLGFDGVRVDSTKSIRKLPDSRPDADGATLLADICALCRRHGRLAVAEDLEDGDGALQQGGLGFHLQWDMALFCWVYDALVHPLDEFRDFGPVVRGLQGLAPSRGHVLRGRVIFMESHDTAASDRYGRVPAAVHHGKAFMAPGSHEGEGGDAFQQVEEEAMPYPSVEEVEANAFAARRAALGLLIVLTAPGVPMILQGQEAGDPSPFKWPNGPGLDWQRVAAQGPALQLCRDLLKLRVSAAEGSPEGSVGPLMGDGLHVFHNYGGVLAYLRWSESTDSRVADASSGGLAIVLINCTHASFDTFELGVPPSSTWRLMASTVSDGSAKGTVFQALKGKPNHNFPCTLALPLSPYSGFVLFRES